MIIEPILNEMVKMLAQIGRRQHIERNHRIETSKMRKKTMKNPFI